MYTRQMILREEKLKKREEEYAARAKLEMLECTFEPSINAHSRQMEATTGRDRIDRRAASVLAEQRLHRQELALLLEREQREAAARLSPSRTRAKGGERRAEWEQQRPKDFTAAAEQQAAARRERMQHLRTELESQARAGETFRPEISLASRRLWRQHHKEHASMPVHERLYNAGSAAASSCDADAPPRSPPRAPAEPMPQVFARLCGISASQEAKQRERAASAHREARDAAGAKKMSKRSEALARARSLRELTLLFNELGVPIDGVNQRQLWVVLVRLGLLREAEEQTKTDAADEEAKLVSLDSDSLLFAEVWSSLVDGRGRVSCAALGRFLFDARSRTAGSCPLEGALPSARAHGGLRASCSAPHLATKVDQALADLRYRNLSARRRAEAAEPRDAMECTFTPRVGPSRANVTPRRAVSPDSRHNPGPDGVFLSLYHEAAEMRQVQDRRRAEHAARMLEGCTFSPTINKPERSPPTRRHGD